MHLSRLTHTVNRRRACAIVLTVAAAVISSLAIPAAGNANATSVIGTWVAADHGPGGWAGGNLLSDGTANGSGQLAFQTPNGEFTAHLTAISWTQVAPAIDSVLTLVDGGAGGYLCLILPVTKGAPADNTPISFASDCSQATPSPGTFGKVNPTSH